jgi:homospermidine synthase
VEANEMDHERCLQIQKQYLGPLGGGFYTDWTPLKNKAN